MPNGRCKKMIGEECTLVDMRDLNMAGLEEFVVEQLGEKKYRAKQIYQWIWRHRATSFDEMSNLSAPLRDRLNEVAKISTLDVATKLESVDGTVKYLWRLADGYTIESVLIPDGERLTLCISSQVGCAMKCSFCLTGDMGLKRHLRTAEIISQPLQVSADLPEGERITNVVMMGMGEPLHNFESVVTALDIMLDDHALNLSHRKVTVSTVGLVPMMAKLSARSPVNLAISVNATSEEQRRQVMPITHKYSLEDLMQAARDFQVGKRKKITIEFVMMGGFNDTLEDAARLYKLLRGVRALVNLIPYNENPGRDIRRPSDESVRAFQHYFLDRGLQCTVRTTRGMDISAACGQLGKAKVEQPVTNTSEEE